jgi:hypothetical protein
MILDQFNINDWNVLILYECTCEDTDYIVDALKDINCPNKYIKEAIDNIDSCNLNIGLTYSNLNRRSSVIVVSKTSSKGQLINTIAHEYFHLICHISKTLKIKDEEKLAILNGELNMKSVEFLDKYFRKVGLE